MDVRSKSFTPTAEGRFLDIWWQFVATLLPLVGALLVSVQLRLRVTYGAPLGAEYVALPPLAFALMGLTGLLVVLLFEVTHSTVARLVFWRFTLALMISFGLMILVLPDLSLLQLFYYIVSGLLIGFLVFNVPRHPVKLSSALPEVWRHRDLILVWTSYTVRSRYSQRVLGILWIILLPLITGVIFSFVFQELMRAAPVDVPFLAFFLTALTFWTVFNQGVMNGTTAVEGKMGLINQIYFPREILVLVRLGEILVDFGFAFLTLVLINWLQGIAPTPLFLYLLPVFLIQICLTLGIMLFVSYLTIFIRDIPQLVGVILQIAFYFSPILYRVDTIPAHLQGIVLVNPLVPIIGAYRDIMLYQRAPDSLSLYYPLVVGVLTLYLGYVFFKANEARLADYL